MTSFTRIPALRCRVVAGAANNQLAEPADAHRIRDAGILYAPDFVINSGGALHLIGTEMLGWDAATLAGRLAGIGAPTSGGPGGAPPTSGGPGGAPPTSGGPGGAIPA